MSGPQSFAIFLLLLASLSPTQQTTQPPSERVAEKGPCEGEMTQAELNQCSFEQYRKADARLNAVYTKLMHLLEKDLSDDQQRNDAGQKKFDEVAIQKLKAVEKAWIQYRDLHCDATRHQIAGGSMSPEVWADCMTNSTDRRIEDLKEAYELGDRKLE